MDKLLETGVAKGVERSTANHAQLDSSSSQAFAAKATDLGALREAVVDAAGVGAGLWISYLFLFFYLFIAVASVTHRKLSSCSAFACLSAEIIVGVRFALPPRDPL
jgi:hypothetical protein